MTDSISTVHLGQFTRETANEIAGELDRAGIVWWFKEPGYLSQVWEFGVRLFVDRARLAEAKEIRDRIVAERNPPPEPPTDRGSEPGPG
ncbi:MAG: hypothetical protein M3Q23_14190 [Actinomycetota bacterium]|nr:hypothetical protein [Actinomycetota bacterium]